MIGATRDRNWFFVISIRGFLYELVHSLLAFTQVKRFFICLSTMLAFTQVKRFFICLSTRISLQSLFVVHMPGHYQASSLIRDTESK
jgi:hypothetical protein